jgi:carbamoyl-phosphate synthase large subunit
MRAGETDVAEVVEDTTLNAAGRQLGEAFGHVGALDVDVFVDGEVVSVLDVNARFGGNYPFAHLAGADVPLTYVRWALGEDVSDDALAVRAGTVGLKAIEPLVVPG